MQRVGAVAKTVSVRDGLFRTKLLEGGQGEPLLFLHGAGGLRGWTPFLGLLAQHFHVYAPWHPGFGESEGGDHIDDMLDLVLYYYDLMDALNIDAGHVIGHSMGGMLAAEMAAIGPQRVRRLVLAAPVGLWLDEHPIPDFFVMPPQELAGALWYDPNSPIARQYQPDPNDEGAMFQAMVERTQAQSIAAKFLWPIPDRGLKKRIGRIRAPTLVVWGEGDGIVPPIYGQEFRQRINGARLVTLRECGHMLLLEKPEEFAGTVVEFLRG